MVTTKMVPSESAAAAAGSVEVVVTARLSVTAAEAVLVVELGTKRVVLNMWLKSLRRWIILRLFFVVANCQCYVIVWITRKMFNFL
jgi:hypothetical protein